MRKLFKLFGGVGALALVAGLAIGAYAFTNSITVNGAGPSNEVIAGYGTQSAPALTASAIHFAVDATDPSKFDSVSFTLSDGTNAVNSVGTGGTVQVQYASNSSITGCTNASGVWTCTPASAISLSAVTEFNVTAAQ
jgi:hypothetical protein